MHEYGMRPSRVMTPVEYGEYLASLEPPINDEQAEAAARVFLTVTRSSDRATEDPTFEAPQRPWGAQPPKAHTTGSSPDGP